jgi:diguanylate cyclase (GGDEF)-like protein
MENGSLSHKLTYAKLYKPYNWVIATGVNIDDVDKLIQRETENSTLLLNEIRMKYYKMSLLVILFSLLVIFIFERLMLSLIVKFQDTVNQKNLEIQLEKERIEQFAYLDPLTGLLNRRSMFDKLHKAVDEYNRYKVGFSIAIADIDDFKQVNDNYGHMAGDYLLKRISNLMITYTRTNDSVCRWGGEEFLLLLSHIDISSATSKLEELRQLIEQEDFIYENTKINCTISIGLAYFSSDNATFEDIIKIADLRLYQAKSNGKNQVVSDST